MRDKICNQGCKLCTRGCKHYHPGVHRLHPDQRKTLKKDKLKTRIFERHRHQRRTNQDLDYFLHPQRGVLRPNRVNRGGVEQIGGDVLGPAHVTWTSTSLRRGSGPESWRTCRTSAALLNHQFIGQPLSSPAPTRSTSVLRNRSRSSVKRCTGPARLPKNGARQFVARRRPPKVGSHANRRWPTSSASWKTSWA